MIFSRHPRRGLQYSTHSLFPYSKSHRIISFADPHPLNLLESYRFKNIGGRGRLQPSNLPTSTPRSEPSSFFSCPCALSFATARPYHSCFQILAHSFYHDGGCTPLLIPPRLKMNQARANSRAANDPTGRVRRHSTCDRCQPHPRFASHPLRFLVNYLDPILQRVGPGEHFPRPTQRPRS